MSTANATLNPDGSLSYYENNPQGGVSLTTLSASDVQGMEQMVQYWVDHNTPLTGPINPGVVASANLAIQNGLITANQFNTWAGENNIQSYVYSSSPTAGSSTPESATTAVSDPLITSDGGVPTQSQATASYQSNVQGQSGSEIASQQTSPSASQPGPTLTTTHSAVNDTVQTAYIAYYGRPADPAGLAYWAGQLQAAGGNLNAIVNAFGNSTESQALYAGQSVTQEITNIYQQQFNRAPDASGLTFWTQQISSGKVSLADAALAIFNGATGVDKTTIDNKLVVADSYTDTLTHNSIVNAAYAGNTAASNARSYLSSVSTDTTMASKIASIASQVAQDIGSSITTDLASVGATPYTGGGASTVAAVSHSAAPVVVSATATPVTDVHLIGVVHASVELFHA
jgi:hypothetical protein